METKSSRANSGRIVSFVVFLLCGASNESAAPIGLDVVAAMEHLMLLCPEMMVHDGYEPNETARGIEDKRFEEALCQQG